MFIPENCNSEKSATVPALPPLCINVLLTSVLITISPPVVVAAIIADSVATVNTVPNACEAIVIVSFASLVERVIFDPAINLTSSVVLSVPTNLIIESFVLSIASIV